jgi:hypothetical protein
MELEVSYIIKRNEIVDIPYGTVTTYRWYRQTTNGILSRRGEAWAAKS